MKNQRNPSATGGGAAGVVGADNADLFESDAVLPENGQQRHSTQPDGVHREVQHGETPSPPSPTQPLPAERRRPMPGILRLDMNKPRRSSGGSVEFRAQPQMLGEDIGSPTGVTSPHQLSVTWATPYDSSESELKFKPMQNYADASAAVNEKGRRRSAASQEEKPYELPSPLEAIDFPLHQQQSFDYNDNNDDDDNNGEDDEEDYSISVSAIMQRRASVRGYRNKRGSRNSRRASSPMDHVLDNAERRRSSVYTTSSDEGTNQESTQEQIFENIRLHKEVIQSVKLQPWPMRKKLKLVRQAKTYVARHEGALQERFAMSRSTKDLWARFKILMAARWRHWKRETASFLTVLIPWELRIKEIESHFGSGVASYFTFLRWLMWVNIMIAIPLVAFVIGPEYFATKKDETDPRKMMSDHEKKVAGNLFTIWEFEGYLKYSPMFYGYYSSQSGVSLLGYKLPMAYFLTAVVVYIYSFVATLRKMAENSRNSKLSSKDDECTFSWKLFTGWDFMIGHAETSHNRIASVVVGFKEALLEEAEKKKNNRNWRIILQRILVNILIMGLLGASGYTVVALVNHADELAMYDYYLTRNAVNVTMTLLSFFMPMIFEALGLFENWHPRQQLRLQLARIMILNMLNLYSLMFSFIYKINSKEKPLQELKIQNDTATVELAHLTSLIDNIKSITTTTLGIDLSSSAYPDESMSTTSSDFYSSSTTETILTTSAAAIYGTMKRLKKCTKIKVNCSKPIRFSNRNISTTLLLINLTTTMIPLTTEPTATPTSEPTTLLWTTLPTTMTTTEATTEATSTLTTLLATTTQQTETTHDEDTTLNYEETTTNDDFSSTTPQSTSTTTPSPGNDSFFEYYDYFVGMPLDAVDNDEEEEEQDVDDDDGTSKSTTKSAGSKTTSSGKTLRRLSRQPRQAAEEVPVLQLRKSKYSRRRNDTTEAAPILTNTEASLKSEEQRMDDGDDYSEETTTSPTSTTTTTTAAPTTTTTSTISDRQQQDAQSASADLRNESAVLWEPNETRRRKVFAYFTTSTTTAEPPPSTMVAADAFATDVPTMSTDGTTTTNADNEDNVIFSDTTPYIITGDEETEEPIYYESGQIDDDDFEQCYRIYCEEIPDDSSNSTDASKGGSNSTELAIPMRTPLEQYQSRLSEVRHTLHEIEKNLTSMCWETSLGQELSKVIVFDGLMSIAAPLCIDFLRALFVRYVNQNWCWDMEKTFPQYGDFKIAENILTLINNQGQVWMGIFFSPGLVLINLVKLIIMMYFRSWIVLTCNVPHEVVFKASKSNNFYLSLLLTMLFLCVLPVGYAIVWLRPSWHCGPFSEFNRISEFITNTTRNALPQQLHDPLNYLTSSSTVIPLLLLLILIIYYLVSLTGALREANQDLRTQLQKEREEERKKIFKVPETKPSEPTAETLTNRWRKVLEASSPVTPTSQPPDFETEEYKNQARKELISRIMKKALRKGSATSDEDSVVRHGRDDDDTDTEHHDSLPHDEEAKDKRFGLSKLQQIRRTRKPSLVDIVQIAKSERERAAAATTSTTPKTPTPPSATASGGKETHPRGRFKVEKHEKRTDKEKEKEKEKEPKQSTDNDNDPEINSRIVNERRQSLLRRQHRNAEDGGERKPIEKQNSDEHQDKQLAAGVQATEVPPTTSKPKEKSNFEVIDEKKPSTSGNEQQHPEGGLFKFKRHKTKPPPYSAAAPVAPEVFKFDEKSVEKTNNRLGRPVDIPIIPAAEHLSAESHAPKCSEEITTPTHAGPKQANNSDKLVNLSRQGRKKIGSFLALMREAVNTRKPESEPQTPEPPTTPITPHNNNNSSSNNNNNNNITAIEIPSTPEAEPVPQPAPVFKAPVENIATPAVTPASTPTAAPAAVAATESSSPPKSTHLEDPEELDQHGPIVFPVRIASQRRRTIERVTPMRQDSQTSVWSDNIPTITISTTGSEECILEPELQNAVPAVSSPVAPIVNIIEINLED